MDENTFAITCTPINVTSGFNKMNKRLANEEKVSLIKYSGLF